MDNEQRTHLIEVYKHITTISSGSLVILVSILSAFPDSFVAWGMPTIILTWALAAFMVSIFGSLDCMMDLAKRKPLSEISGNFSIWGLMFGMLFLLLTAYAIVYL